MELIKEAFNNAWQVVSFILVIICTGLGMLWVCFGWMVIAAIVGIHNPWLIFPALLIWLFSAVFILTIINKAE